ncbi:MAG: bifunctional demethylmenaquinone methyltransferase/2-methoxy-6-polyprenyl-1,4-benzoquinol methylase UbiE [Bdellovibrionaceae bacterium]|nr:bifunctional demethylmenaquinone methyltransferase/2-methoxy-6-polyprenyl-1,4-benzoquinol methylase UbiE [Pseudobdellovibrionaceae bacterium]
MEKHTVQADKIRSMFAKVAPSYDAGNQILSMGVHHLWRKKLVKISRAKAGEAVLDCATGTGDLAIEFKKAVGPTGQVVGTDFCAEMLVPAPAKARERGLDIKFEEADVTKLPYADASFDIVSISFGIRNVENPLKGLSEMARVLKPGGRLLVLEFGKVRLPVFAQIYNFYSENILPKLGGLVSGQTEAYEYLQKSSAAFPSREDFLALMEKTGQLKNMRYSSLTGGIAYIYDAEKK